jgi:proton-translocating NADH-quinone oxidoreductase chain L
MYLILIILPLLGSVFAGLFGRFVGRKGSVVITVTFLIMCFALSCFAFYEVALCGSVCSIKIMEWFSSELFDAEWGLYFDTLTVVMLVVITSVSSLVHIYSVSYMSEDPHLPRFMSYLSIFTFFMLMLVTADNLLQMFFGWEGVGLASYLMINFWFTRLQANKASIKAMLVNRVGDFGLALGIMTCFSVFKSVNFATIFASTPFLANTSILFFNHSFDTLTVIAICLFIGAVGKSAQLGLHTWLPDAMEGPTPVSALIHAATMVTAGVFMIARCSAVFEYAPSALMLVALVGAMTSLFAASTGVVQNDIKRVIAYSTCSQLGYMVFACGISNYSVGVFHLINHAFFKALLFLGAGSVIHALSNEQDMRKMGGSVQLLPFTYAMMLIGSLSLVGFPFLTGFYSKDVILEVAYAQYTINGNFAYWLGSICVLFTSYYSFRLLFLTFLSPSSSTKLKAKHVHDPPLLMAIPLMLLALGSIFVGFLGKDMMIGIGTDFWGNSIFVLPSNSTLLESEFIPQVIKILPLGFTVGGLFLAFIVNIAETGKINSYKMKTSRFGIPFYYMLNKRWFFDKVYNDFLSQKLLDFGYLVSFKRLDKGCLEIIGPYGISLLFSKVTRNISRLQSGMIYHYAVMMLVGLILFITTVGLWDSLEQFVDNRLYFVLFVGYIVLSTLLTERSSVKPVNVRFRRT